MTISVGEQREHTISDDRERAFQKSVECRVDYFAAIREAGDLPWFAVGHPRRDEVITRLGLPEDVSELDLRRAFFMERYR